LRKSLGTSIKKQEEIIELIKQRYRVEDERLKELIDKHFEFIKSKAELDFLIYQEDQVEHEFLILNNNLDHKIEEIRGFFKDEYPEMFEALDTAEFFIRNEIIYNKNMGTMYEDRRGRVQWKKPNREYTDKSYKEYQEMQAEREKEILAKVNRRESR
jgi:glutamate synthase domain-containing protein 3